MIMVPFTDEILYKKTNPINVENPEFDIRKFQDEMLWLMFQQGGVGLSANQIGIPLSAFVVGNGIDKNFGKIYINPKIIRTSPETSVKSEGCLSFPNLELKIVRPEVIILEYYDVDLEKKQDVFGGLTGRVMQHEMCHLEGKAFFHSLSEWNLKRQLTKSDWQYNVLKKFLT